MSAKKVSFHARFNRHGAHKSRQVFNVVRLAEAARAVVRGVRYADTPAANAIRIAWSNR